MTVMQPEVPSKPTWESKTIWANMIMGALAFAPVVNEVVTPEVMPGVMVIVNILLRLLSNGKVTLK